MSPLRGFYIRNVCSNFLGLAPQATVCRRYAASEGQASSPTRARSGMVNIQHPASSTQFSFHLQHHLPTSPLGLQVFLSGGGVRQRVSFIDDWI